MTAFLIICELLVLLLVISMVYLVEKLAEQYKKGLTGLTGEIAMLSHRIKKLEERVTELEHAES